MRRALRLVDLPEGVLTLILSFLGTLSVAALRLTCRSLRTASTRARKRVVLVLDGYYGAAARASGHVLRTMHIFQDRLDRVDEDLRGLDGRQRGPDVASVTAPSRSDYQAFRRFLQKQLLLSVSHEVEALRLEFGWRTMMGRLLDDLLPRMRRLQRLRVPGPSYSALLQDLPDLRCLTCLNLGPPCSIGDIQELSSAFSLSHLRALRVDQPLDVPQVLAALAEGGVASHLQEVALRVPGPDTAHLSCLTALGALTALELEVRETGADLEVLASLTGLKRLKLAFLTGRGSQPIVESLSPLTAFTGLTLLDLRNSEGNGEGSCCLPFDVAALSALAALRVLRVSFAGPAEVLPRGDPLPAQVRFLRSATALEELDLGFGDGFWSLPPASSLAMREVVAALSSLKVVAISAVGVEVANYPMPLGVFAAGRSITSFRFSCLWPYPAHVAGSGCVRARTCFGRLPNLQSLTLQRLDAAFDAAALLAGLPCTRLTHLSLTIKADTVPQELRHQIVRFRDLEALEVMWSNADSSFLAQLAQLKFLVRLKLNVAQKPGADASAVSALKEQAAQLEAAIVERARALGVMAQVRLHVW